MKHITTIVYALILSLNIAFAQDKIVVESADDLPRLSYATEFVPSEAVLDKDAVLELALPYKKDIEEILETYDIQDKATLKGYLGTLRDIALIQGDYDTALEYTLEVRELQEKPADKLTSGLSSEVLINLMQAGKELGTDAFAEAFVAAYAEKIDPLPWDVVQDNIERSKGSMEMFGQNLIVGLIQSRIDPGVAESAQIGSDAVASVASYYVFNSFILPVKESMVSVLGNYISENRVEKPDIWAERDVDLAGMEGLTDVIVGIWDSGIDVEIFEPKGKVWINESETGGDEVDNDENAWIDDVNGFAHDLASRKDIGNLVDLPEEVDARYMDLVSMYKGISDVQAAVDSEEATEFKQYIGSLKPEEVENFLLDLGHFGNYVHGTHVAGIAAAGNPAVKLMNGRITFDHKVIPDVPTIEEYVRGARAYQEAVDYFKDNGARIVNMSWGGTQAMIEGAFEANGVGDDAEMRAEMARILFDISYTALVDAMASAPEILFIPAAGNSDSNVEFNQVIPSSIDLPNVLVAGAVDQAGDETGFTSYGENVQVHANGFEVDSYLPGGVRQTLSGTSMSAPNVANLAAKLLAIDPSLSPEDVVSLIKLGATPSDDGRRNLIHPQKSIELLKLRNQQG